jgi:HK97 family phage prohead protease
VTTERRSAQVEIRAAGRKLAGYAALFNTETDIGGKFRERIAPGAFVGSLDKDVLALVDHDTSRILARTRSKTLRLEEDTRGLHFDLDLPATGAGNDILELARRGDLGGMSFGFRVPKGGETWEGDTRTLRSVDLIEVSVVSGFPAYEGTTVDVRARPLVAPFRLLLATRYLETL